MPRNHNKAPNYKLRRGVAASLAAVALVGGPRVVEAIGSNDVSAEAKQFEEWQKEGQAPKLYNGTVILNEGVALRSSPEMKFDREDTGETANIVNRVPEGKAVVAPNPVKLSAEGDDWFGITMADETVDGKKPEDMARRTYWVNASELGRQQPNSENALPFIEVFPNFDVSGRYQDIVGSIEEGQVVISGKDGSVPAALGQTVAVENLDAFRHP